MNLRFISAVLLLIGLSACSKSPSANAEYSLTVTIDGTNTWTTTDVAISKSTIYTYITATRPATKEQIVLTLTNYSGVNNYNIQNSGNGVNPNLSSGMYLASGLNTGFVAMNGCIYVTKDSANTMHGNFIINNTDPSGGGTASGTFIVPRP
jgi:hypothetical protein